MIVRALAALLWPTIVIVGLVLFRQQLRELVGRVARARFPGVELDLAPLVHEAEELSAEAEARGLAPELVARLDRVEQQIKLVASTNPTSGLARLTPSTPHGGGAITFTPAPSGVPLTGFRPLAPGRFLLDEKGNLRFNPPDPPTSDD